MENQHTNRSTFWHRVSRVSKAFWIRETEANIQISVSMRISHLDDSATLNPIEDKRIPAGLPYNKGLDHDADVVMQEQDIQDGRLYESPRVGEPAYAKPAITPNAKFTTSVANKRGELPVVDQSNALLGHTSQALRENDGEMV